MHASTCGFIALGCAFLFACTSATNSREIREREAALIPPDLYELAPNVAIAISPLRIEFSEEKFSFYSQSGATGTLLPNGEMLTAAHAFKEDIQLAQEPPKGVIYPFLVDQSAQFVSVFAFEPVGASNGDWALLSFMPSKSPVRPPDPQTARSIRFDGRAFIQKGTPLYCIGFPRTPGEKPGLAGLARTLTIVQGRATRDFGPDEEIEGVSDTKLDMRGMSGGPVGTYDFWKRELTVVGTAARGTNGARILGLHWPYFCASRIAPVVMQRLPTQQEAHLAPLEPDLGDAPRIVPEAVAK